MSAAIRFSGVSKDYPATAGRRSIKEMLVDPRRLLWSRERETVLRDVDLEIARGECVGVVGRNGAGKSTLLSLMLGVSVPSRGSIAVDGRCTPLLELGAGFHPDLTGLENALLYGVLLGLPRQRVLDRLDAIVAYSELGEAVHRPIRTYSDGMQVRLGFAVAIHTDPEILLIDEILAVGDVEFQAKSRESIGALIRGGVTTVLVSHDLEEVELLANRVAWIDDGRIVEIGSPSVVIDRYRRGCAVG